MPMKQTDILAVMKTSPMFSALGVKQLGVLREACHVQAFAPLEQVFRPTQEADRFFLVLSGRVRIYKVSPRGDEQTLHIYGRGETFAEAAALCRLRYPAFAEAMEESTLLAIPRKTLAQAIARNSEFALGMLAGLSAKLREFAGLIEALSLKEVPARLAGVLLAEAKRHNANPFRLRHSKRQLASQIGTVAETLSRALARLKADRIVSIEGSEVTILDPDALADLAENG